ncbi:HPP family protein [Endozoicomonas sp. (ex Bugula neritina AB1)]|nr:HPP family protein [Endozoicomonas sp. (ex Bugula neritina AB1)]
MNKLMTSLFAGIAAAVAIGILAYTDVAQEQMILVMAPFGASAVLVFGVPDSPLAQPKNVILGRLLTAFIGIVFTQYIGVNPMMMAIATGLGITGMLSTNTTHPPAGANPMLIMMAGQSWSFLITPVLVGSVAIVAVGMVHKKLRKELAIA